MSLTETRSSQYESPFHEVGFWRRYWTDKMRRAASKAPDPVRFADGLARLNCERMRVEARKTHIKARRVKLAKWIEDGIFFRLALAVSREAREACMRAYVEGE